MFDPQTGLLQTRVEMQLSQGEWVDITDDVNTEDPITIDRGSRDESSNSEPSTCTMMLSNTDGKYSPWNPRSPYYERFGRNTQIRVRVGDPDVALLLPREQAGYASTPDAAALDITGDLDIRLEIVPDGWRPESLAVVAAKYDGSSDDRSWALRLYSDGRLDLAWAPDGTAATRVAAVSTASVPLDTAAVRVVMDVDNGAGGHDVLFYTAASLAGAWSQLGATVTAAGATSLFSSAAELSIGALADGTLEFGNDEPFAGRVVAFELRDGIDGTLAASVDFTSFDSGLYDTTVTAADGLPWTLSGAATTVDPSVRFRGEVTSWPPRWTSPAYVWAPIVASGITRRLAQGAPALDSAMRRGITSRSDTAPIAYWPMEDSSGASSFASALGHSPITLGQTASAAASTDVRFAAYSGFASSKPIPEFSVTAAVAEVPWVPPTGELRVFHLLHLPEDGVDHSDGPLRMLNMRTSGTVGEWAVEIGSPSANSSLRMRAWNRSGDSILTSGWVNFALNGDNCLFGIWLRQNGNLIDWQIFAGVEGFDTIGISEGSLAGQTLGSATQVRLGAIGDFGGTAIGHLAVYNRNTNEALWSTQKNLLDAWTGESAAARFARLSGEEDVPAMLVGSPDDGQRLGPQTPQGFLDLLGEAADSDMSILAERRDAAALLWINRRELYNQDPFQLDYCDLAPPFEPEGDDQRTRNDITVTRNDGSSYRVQQLVGPLNVQHPSIDPLGVGRYTSEVDLSLHSDGQLPDQGYWRLHLGTVIEPRYPTMRLDIHGSPHLLPGVADLDLGSRITIANPPEWLPPDDIDLIVTGYTEVIEGLEWSMSFTCIPGSPYRTWIAEDDALGRADVVLAAMATPVFTTGTDTEMLVHTLIGPGWTTDPAEFPFDIAVAGVRLRVTAIEPGLQDTFDRSVVDGWGSPDVGPAWVTAGGAASDFSVGSSRGFMTLSTESVERSATLGLAISDVDMRMAVSTPQIATGAWIIARLMARRISTDTWLAAQVEFKDTGNVGLGLYEVVDGAVVSFLGGAEIGAYSPGEEFGVTLRADDSDVSASIWRVASGEDTATRLGGQVAELTGFGDCGVLARRDPGNTNSSPALSFHDISMSNPQRFTVEQAPINGVEKTFVAGARVQLYQPAIVGL